MGKVYRVAIYSLAAVGLVYVLLLVAVSAGPMSERRDAQFLPTITLRPASVSNGAATKRVQC